MRSVLLFAGVFLVGATLDLPAGWKHAREFWEPSERGAALGAETGVFSASVAMSLLVLVALKAVSRLLRGLGQRL